METKKKYESVKATKDRLTVIFGKDFFYRQPKNHWGDRSEYGFHFPDSEIEKRYYDTEKSNLDPDGNIYKCLDNELRQNGFEVFNMGFGTHVYHYSHRVVKLIKE